ncbi:hypothetical protein GF412_00525 [Candidatus Micrarchaeota archaeon]|nr:hypothetical protein [Candidatus Micrarchaeota archaeon]MBD3417460.1 hypothetical protein [Candidatus Micrarchaeota archaeon]
MNKAFVIQAASARDVPRKMVEPNARTRVIPQFPKTIRGLVEARTALDSVDVLSPKHSPFREAVYGYNAGRREMARKLAISVHLEALKKGDMDSAERIAKKFGLSPEDVDANFECLSEKELCRLQKTGPFQDGHPKARFIEDEIREETPEIQQTIDRLLEKRLIVFVEGGADRLAAFSEYCHVLVENILYR